MRLITSLATRALGLFGSAPLLVWPLAAAVAWGAAGEWRVRGLRADIAELQASQERARADAATETTRRVEALQEVIRHANQYRIRIEGDRVAADGAGRQLQRRLADAVAAARSATACGSAPAGDPIGVLADVLSRADARAGILAVYADRARAAGAACVSAYEALTFDR